MNNKNWLSPRNRRFLAIVSLLSLVGTSSCSRQKRISNALSESEMFTNQAIEAILDGDIAASKELAEKAFRFADKANRSAQALDTKHPYRTKAQSNFEDVQTLAEAYNSPEGSLKMWWDAVGSGNTKLARSFFDTSSLIDSVFEDYDITEEQKLEVEESFISCLTRMYSSFGATVNSLDIKVEGIRNVKGKTLADCSIKMPYGAAPATWAFSLTNKEGLFVITDLVYMGARVTEHYRQEAKTRGPEGMKEWFDTASLSETLEGLAPFFTKDDLVGTYVTPLETLELSRGSEKLKAEPGRYLTVLNQRKTGDGDEILWVSTNETDRSQKYMAEVRRSKVKPYGTNETELWGLDTSNQSE